MAAGDTIRALDWPVALQVKEDADADNIGTTFLQGAVACSGTFIANTAGKCKITVWALANADLANDIVSISFSLYQGTNDSGTIVAGPANERAARIVCMQALGSASGQYSEIITGLTAGATHFARTMHASASGTAGSDVVNRMIIVEPVQ